MKEKKFRNNSSIERTPKNKIGGIFLQKMSHCFFKSDQMVKEWLFPKMSKNILQKKLIFSAGKIPTSSPFE